MVMNSLLFPSTFPDGIFYNILSACRSLTTIYRHSVDTRDRRDRVELQANQWDCQMPRLVEAYLDYRSRDLGEGFPTDVPHEVNQEHADPSGTISDVELVDLFCMLSYYLC